MKLEFSGNLALILGASSDLAIHLAQSMFVCGITPVLSYRNEKGLKKIKDALAGNFEKVSTIHMNFSEVATLENLTSELTAPPDYLIDFAQPDYERLIASADIGDVYRYFEAGISFRAAMLNRVGRMMLTRKKGRCIFVSSTAAVRPNPGQGFYAASKLASEALYKCLGRELGGRGITTIILRPGYVDAGRGRRYLKEKGAKNALSRVPLKREITPREISETILFYLSESARGFNATEICIDGGLLAEK